MSKIKDKAFGVVISALYRSLEMLEHQRNILKQLKVQSDPVLDEEMLRLEKLVNMSREIYEDGNVDFNPSDIN